MTVRLARQKLESFDPAFMPPPAVVALEIPDLVMEMKMLDTLKARAEGRPAAVLVAVFEITLWLAVLAASLLAGWRFLDRTDDSTRCTAWQTTNRNIGKQGRGRLWVCAYRRPNTTT